MAKLLWAPSVRCTGLKIACGTVEQYAVTSMAVLFHMHNIHVKAVMCGDDVQNKKMER
jgi:hypothetical protein